MKATRGKWGVTRGEDGTLAYIMEWPWFWRYPVGVITLAGSAAFAYWLLDAGKSEWVALGLGGVGVLWALSTMYELGCLSVALAIGWGLWTLLSYWFPGLRELNTSWQLGLLAAFAYYAWYVGNEARVQAAANKRVIDGLWQRLNQMQDSIDLLHSDIWDLKQARRIRNELDDDPF